MIAVVDCEIGNLRSVEKALQKTGAQAKITFDAKEIERAEAVVLPGVGAFSDAIEFIRRRRLEPVIRDAVEAGKPVLGICLGLQLFLSESEEGGRRPGLGLIEGRVVRFPDTVKVPQMGWNQIKRRAELPLFDGIPEDAFFYFAHSYYAVPERPADVAATTDYGVEYASSVARDNLVGVQFHPEKSGTVGLQMLANFARLAHGG